MPSQVNAVVEKTTASINDLKEKINILTTLIKNININYRSLKSRLTNVKATAERALKYINIIEDKTPQLGGNLDMQTYKLVGEGGSAGVYVDSAGFVGIGTDAPKAKLFVANGELFVDYSTGGVTGGAAFRLNSNGTSAYFASNAYYNGGTKYARDGGASQMVFDISTNATAGDIKFYTSPSGIADAARPASQRMTIKQDGNVGITTTTPTAKLDVNSDILRLRTAKTPATAGAAGNTGDVCWDINYIYICINTNTWKRVAITSW